MSFSQGNFIEHFYIHLPCLGRHHCMTPSFINKDLSHPTGEFNSLDLRVCVQVWTDISGYLVQVRMNYYLMTALHFPTQSISFFQFLQFLLQYGSWRLMSFPTSFTCRTTRLQCQAHAWPSANGCSAFRRKSCSEKTHWHCTIAFTR